MLRHYFLVLYDNLGQAVLSNLAWSLACLPWVAVAVGLTWCAAWAGVAFGQPAFEAIGLLAGVLFVVWSPPTLLLYALTHSWIAADADTDWREALGVARRQAVRAQLAGLLLTVVLGLLLGNALFYHDWGGWLGLSLSGVMLWLIVGVMLTAQLLFPVLVANPDIGLLAAMRHCALLVLDNVGRSMLLILATGLCLLLGVVSGVGLVLGLTTATALIGTLGLRVLMRRYGGASIEPDRRGLRDLLRPWQA